MPGKRYLLDTNALVALLQGNQENVRNWKNSVANYVAPYERLTAHKTNGLPRPAASQ